MADPQNNAAQTLTDQQMELIEALKSCLENAPYSVVPIIGDDMFEYFPGDGSKRSVKDFVCDKLLSTVTHKEKTAVKASVYSSYYYGVSRLKIKSPIVLHSAFKNAVNQGVIKLKKCVSDFLKAYNFPVVITTFGFPIMENEKSLWYNPTMRNDLPIYYPGKSQRVYHIFGGDTVTNWAYNENTLLKFMHSLHSIDYGAKSLANYLRGGNNETPKSLLVLGSYLPDWLYRFLVYPMYEDEMRDTSGFWVSADILEESLGFFLTQNNYECSAGSPCDTIVNELIPPDPIPPIPVPDELPSCFLSYKRPNTDNDKAQVSRIQEILKQQSNDVWVDFERIEKIGENYWQKIKDAVRKCSRFVVLVSNGYINDFADAPDLGEIINTYPELQDAKADDEPDVVKSLKPVVREALYCLLYGKDTVCCPIVYNPDGSNLTSGKVEAVASDKNDKRNLPQSMFVGRNMTDYDDNDPKTFNL